MIAFSGKAVCGTTGKYSLHLCYNDQTKMQHAWWSTEMHTKFWLESLKERHHSKDLGTDKKITLNAILKKEDGKMETGFIWLMI
jgi:hypothetical protein